MRLSHHALDRMALRGITTQDVELALATSRATVDHPLGTTSHLGTALDGRGIVVVTETDDIGRIITVMLEETR